MHVSDRQLSLKETSADPVQLRKNFELVTEFATKLVSILTTGAIDLTPKMGHISGGAISGIIFGTMLFVFVSVSMMLWWRRVHLDHFSTAPDAWGGSWGVKAQRELQARIDNQRAARWAAEEEERERAQTQELSRREAWDDVEAHAAATDATEGNKQVPDVQTSTVTAPAAAKIS